MPVSKSHPHYMQTYIRGRLSTFNPTAISKFLHHIGENDVADTYVRGDLEDGEDYVPIAASVTTGSIFDRQAI
ncbi:hypothetical protein J1N35_012184 [Gossypium stocksii]|uniref:Uncharacterized protein n=1 Tax=Gossypium stocksii TaxID=47602 RepID=A0A9D3W3T2_9ROSI|nr:hypothetical protein J1N35_012184 [Gossypium stocksii]